MAGSIYDKPDKALAGKMNFVMANTVFEHLLFLSKALDQLIQYIKPDGYIMLLVPSTIVFPVYDREISN